MSGAMCRAAGRLVSRSRGVGRFSNGSIGPRTQALQQDLKSTLLKRISISSRLPAALAMGQSLISGYSATLATFPLLRVSDYKSLLEGL